MLHVSLCRALDQDVSSRRVHSLVSGMVDYVSNLPDGGVDWSTDVLCVWVQSLCLRSERP